MRPYATEIKCPRWLRLSDEATESLALLIPMWIGVFALLDAWFGIPVSKILSLEVQRIINAIVKGV